MEAKIVTVIEILCSFVNTNGPGKNTFELQKRLEYDLSISKGMKYEIRIFDQFRITEEVYSVMLIDRGNKIFKKVSINHYRFESVEDAYGVSSEKFIKEMETLGFYDKFPPL